MNHATEAQLWVTIFKKKTGILSVTWDDVVVEALYWGRMTESGLVHVREEKADG